MVHYVRVEITPSIASSTLTTMHTLTTTMHRSLEMRLIGIGMWSAPTGRDFPQHVHTCWEVHYYRVGNIVAVINGREYPARPGVITVVPPGVRHGEIAHTDYENYWIRIDAPSEYSWPLVTVDDENASIGQTARSLLRENQFPAVGMDEMQQLLLAQLDIQLLRMREQVSLSRAERLVREAEWTIHERINQPLSIEEIAVTLGVSTSRLRAAFAECRSESPLAVLHRIRADHAVRIIRSTSSSAASLEAIAYSCGYDSASHLSRHVRRRTGMSPGQLRAEPLELLQPAP